MHFLIIDEHPADRDKIIRLLKDTFQNAALTVVDSPETYRQVLTTGPFDCVLTEHTLDWTDGLIVLHELKARWPDVPVIIVTGSGSEQTAVEGFRAGLQDYVRKDQIQTELIPAIRRAAKHKPMEQALRESEETARRQLAEIDSIYGSAPIGLAVLDSELRYVRINDRLAQMNGIPAAAHIGKTVRELLPDLADQAEAIYRDIVSTGEPLLDIEFSGTTPAEPDRARTWLANWLPLRDSGGQVIGMNVVTHEVTERQEAQQALRESRQRLAWMLDKTGVGVWLNELPFGALNWDEQTRKLFFVDPEAEPTIELFWSRIYPDDIEPTRLAVAQAIRDRALYAIDHRAVNPDTGEIRWIRSIGQAHYAEDGTPTYFDGINYDITERKEAEGALQRYAADLEAANQANRILLQEVNHRVKNSLTAILSLIFAERHRLKQERPSVGPDPEPHTRCDSALSDLADRVSSLAIVHSLLSANRWRPLYLAELVDAVIQGITTTLSKPKSLDLEITGASVLLTPEQAHHVALAISELTTNSVKYGCGPTGVHINVDIRLEEGAVRLVYRNQGPEYSDLVLSGQAHSVGLGIVDKLARHSLRGTWTMWNDGGPATEIRFPADPELNRRPAYDSTR